jgi:hypothetical protein
MQKHIGIIIYSGPEVKAFLYSGLTEKLVVKNKISIITKSPESKSFAGIDPRIQILRAPENYRSDYLKTFQYRVSKFHSLMLQKKGFDKWRHYISKAVNNRETSLKLFFQKIISIPLIVYFMSFIAIWVARIIGTNSEWKQIYQKNTITDILASTYSNPEILTALQTASNLNIRTHVATNSWKDIYVNARIPIRFDNLLVWKEEEISFLQHVNPSYLSKNIHNVGSLHLNPFISQSLIIPKSEFFMKFNLNPHRHLITYTTASPNAVLDEESIIKDLINLLNRNNINPKPQLLIRVNPMDTKERYKRFASSDVKIQIPDWEYQPQIDWNSSSKQDLIDWVNIVFYSDMNVSIASTVTLEFATFNKPVINICYDHRKDLDYNSSNIRFWDAPFYKEIREKKLASPVHNINELENEIYKAINSNTSIKTSPWLSDDAAANIARIISDETA